MVGRGCLRHPGSRVLTGRPPGFYAVAITAVLAASLSGCLIDRERYEQRRTQLVDDDGDGLSDAQGDCDDTNAQVWLGAPELCNGFDDNCDGQVDEPAEGNDVRWAADADGDGFAADSATPYAACVSPGAGWVSDAGDCDDADAGAWPGAPEACDGVDNDCDGAADEEPTVAPPTWHPDEDGDGFGQRRRATPSRSPPSSACRRAAGAPWSAPRAPNRSRGIVGRRRSPTGRPRALPGAVVRADVAPPRLHIGLPGEDVGALRGGETAAIFRVERGLDDDAPLARPPHDVGKPG